MPIIQSLLTSLSTKATKILRQTRTDIKRFEVLDYIVCSCVLFINCLFRLRNKENNQPKAYYKMIASQCVFINKFLCCLGARQASECLRSTHYSSAVTEGQIVEYS